MNKGWEKVKHLIADANRLYYQKFKDDYYRNPNLCRKCLKIIPYKKRKNKYCNQSCSALFNNYLRSQIYTCSICSKKYKKANKKQKVCSSSCWLIVCKNNLKDEYAKFKTDPKFGTLANGNLKTHIRDKLINERGNKCEKCKWAEINPVTNKIPLQINHINGKPYDHRIDNLEVLCPNCHSLTPNFGSLNRGNGRKDRRCPRHNDNV